ncbi:MAG: neutral/alkaline non-lysosomal ceramidase N-terminal domain-containing protein [Planctomycetes bacterium]|nr:neutral/alkaline non-lysosomal ceramidase N-terminal domain-containing protein [Planctomycetota bacterium]MBL7039607.1 neutral/alkaline non-lysosomal ceramidase N-terminal domain-containing protein [Pirellulaceae bacterium]
MQIRSSLLAVSATFLVAATPQVDADVWKAGVAEIKITPEKPMWMMGYASRNKPATDKMTELWTKAIALEGPNSTRAVLITIEVSNTYRDLSNRVCEQLADKYQLPRKSIAICATHTHSGPVVGHRAYFLFDEEHHRRKVEYDKTLERKMVAVAGQAIENLSPCRLTWSVGKATFAVNRRNNRAAEVPKLRAAGKLRGPVDHDVPVLFVEDDAGQVRAIVCGYACHATVLSSYEWSGDWPGFAQIEMEKCHPSATAIVWAGCGADQNPEPRRKVEFARQYGLEIAQAVDDARAERTNVIEGRLACHYAEIDLAWAHIPSREELESDSKSTNRYVAARAKQLLAVLDREGQIAPAYPYPVQTWQLGDGPTMVFLGGEVVVDYSLRVKAELDARSTWVAAYANDGMAYIPSERVLGEGGYEGASAMIYYGRPSPWATGIEKRIVDEVHRQVTLVRAEAMKDS